MQWQNDDCVDFVCGWCDIIGSYLVYTQHHAAMINQRAAI